MPSDAAASAGAGASSSCSKGQVEKFSSVEAFKNDAEFLAKRLLPQRASSKPEQQDRRLHQVQEPSRAPPPAPSDQARQTMRLFFIHGCWGPGLVRVMEEPASKQRHWRAPPATHPMVAPTGLSTLNRHPGACQSVAGRPRANWTEPFAQRRRPARAQLGVSLCNLTETL